MLMMVDVAGAMAAIGNGIENRFITAWQCPFERARGEREEKNPKQYSNP